MKVGIISDYYPLYGAKAVQKIVRVLESNGHSAVILSSNKSPKGDEYRAGKYKDGQSDLVRFSSRSIVPSGTPMTIPIGLPFLSNRFFSSHQVDIVHVHFLASYSFQIYALLSRITKKYPIIATPHGVVRGYPSPIIRSIASGIRLFSRVTLPIIDLFTVVSKETSNFLNELGIPNHKIRYIPNWVDTDRFSPRTRTEAQTALGLENNQSVKVLYLAHLRETKGIEIFLEVASEILKNNTGVEFLIIGSGPQEDYVKMKCKRSKGKIQHISYLKEELLPLAYNAADIYVLPSFVEGLPQSLLEAMSSGVPCIATNVGGVAELFPRNSPYLIPSGNESELLSRLELLIQNSKLRREIGRSMRKYIVENYSEKIIGTKYLDLYTEVLRV